MYPTYKEYEFGTQAETGVEVAGLGLAAWQVVQPLASGGDLSVAADVATYVHQNTPAHIPFTKASVEFLISAHHPRYGFDRQEFYFRLSFEYNRYDLRNVSIIVLRDKSSSLHASSFDIYFKATPYSQPSEPTAKIVYNIQGRWDPFGLGDVSFEGTLIVQADGRARGNIVSERDWVRWDGFLSETRQDIPIGVPPTPGLVPSPSPQSRPILRTGSRGQAVTDLQIRLNRWLVSQGRQPLTVDGIFRSRTRAAVVAFQQAAGVRPDGIVGTQTWAVLTRNW